MKKQLLLTTLLCAATGFITAQQEVAKDAPIATPTEATPKVESVKNEARKTMFQNMQQRAQESITKAKSKLPEFKMPQVKMPSRPQMPNMPKLANFKPNMQTIKNNKYVVGAGTCAAAVLGYIYNR